MRLVKIDALSKTDCGKGFQTLNQASKARNGVKKVAWQNEKIIFLKKNV